MKSSRPTWARGQAPCTYFASRDKLGDFIPANCFWDDAAENTDHPAGGLPAYRRRFPEHQICVIKNVGVSAKIWSDGLFASLVVLPPRLVEGTAPKLPCGDEQGADDRADQNASGTERRQSTERGQQHQQVGHFSIFAN